jgi:hypothetical protein
MNAAQNQYIEYRMPIVCRPLQLMGEIEYEG